MPSLSSIIKEVEDKWLMILYKHCEKLFDGHNLVSHDHDHHFRTWCIAKSLLFALVKYGYTIDKTLVEQMIIAVFFHDTGMIETINPEHGIVSSKYCKAFFKNNHLDKPEGLPEIINAIEQHDNKNYTFNHNGTDSLLTNLNLMLTVCDDLEAFGITGIYRYIEIYSRRGIDKKEIPEKAIGNAKSRYKHFESKYNKLDDLIKVHKNRYDYLETFFKSVFNPGVAIINGLHFHRIPNIYDCLYKISHKENKAINDIPGRLLNCYHDEEVEKFRIQWLKEL